MFHACNPVVACRWYCYLVATMVVRTRICKLLTSFLAQEYIIQETVDPLTQFLLVGKHPCCMQKRILGLVCVAWVVLVVLLPTADVFLVTTQQPGYSKWGSLQTMIALLF